MSSLPLVSFLITLLLGAAVCTHGEEPVKDSDGNLLHTNEPYFIEPVKGGSSNGGGLVPAAVSLIPFCPLGINQAVPYQPGTPVSFAPPRGFIPASSIVLTNIYYTIEFKSDTWPFCNDFSKFLGVDESSSASKEPAIIIGGDPQRTSSRFKVEKAGEEEGINIYKLSTCTGSVGAIPGIWEDAPQLVLTNDTARTLLVKFNKADDDDSTSTSLVEKSGLRMFPLF